MELGLGLCLQVALGGKRKSPGDLPLGADPTATGQTKSQQSLTQHTLWGGQELELWGQNKTWETSLPRVSQSFSGMPLWRLNVASWVVPGLQANLD